MGIPVVVDRHTLNVKRLRPKREGRTVASELKKPDLRQVTDRLGTIGMSEY